MTTLATPVFGLTPADVKKRLNPLNELHGFNYATVATDDTPIAEAEVYDALLTYEDRVLSEIPERYRQLLRHIDGEILTDYAAQDEYQFTLSMFPATNLKLYCDYGRRWGAALVGRYTADDRVGQNQQTRPWSDRTANDVLAPANYSVTLATGVITLNPKLSLGQSLYAEYDHAGASTVRSLRHIVLLFAAADIAGTLPMTAERIEIYRDWRIEARANLKRISGGDGAGGIDQLDKIKLVHETRNVENVAHFPALGGW